MFGNYQFSSANKERLGNLCKQLRSREDLNLSRCHPLSIFFSEVDSVSVTSDITPTVEDTELPSMKERCTEDEVDLIYLSDSSDGIPCPPAFFTPSISENAISDPKEDVIDSGKTVASPSSSQLTQSLAKRAKIEFPDILLEFQDDLLKLKDLLDSVGNADSCKSSFINSLSSEQMEALLKFVKVHERDEQKLLSFCSMFMATSHDSLSYNCGVVFINICVLPMIANLDHNVSWQLLSTLSAFFKIYPLLWVFLLSKIVVDARAVSSSHVADFLLKVIKNNIDQGLSHHNAELSIFDNILQNIELLNENFIPVLQALIEKHKKISDEELEMFVSLLEKSHQKFSKSLKFSKLILKFVQQFGKQLNEKDKAIVKNVIEGNQTFLKRSLETNFIKETLSTSLLEPSKMQARLERVKVPENCLSDLPKIECHSTRSFASVIIRNYQGGSM